VTCPRRSPVSNVAAPLLVPIVFGGVTRPRGRDRRGDRRRRGAARGGNARRRGAEVALIEDARAAAREEGIPLGRRPAPRRWPVFRVAAARVIAHVPLWWSRRSPRSRS
jgi:hypothetical protein